MKSSEIRILEKKGASDQQFMLLREYIVEWGEVTIPRRNVLEAAYSNRIRHTGTEPPIGQWLVSQTQPFGCSQLSQFPANPGQA